MPAPRTLPRHEGMILLHNQQTLNKLNVPADADEKDLERINDTLREMLDTAARSFYIETGRVLIIEPDEDAGFRWCVEDVPLNSSQYPWLQRKCLKLERNIANRMNKDGIKGALSSPNHR